MILIGNLAEQISTGSAVDSDSDRPPVNSLSGTSLVEDNAKLALLDSEKTSDSEKNLTKGLGKISMSDI